MYNLSIYRVVTTSKYAVMYELSSNFQIMNNQGCLGYTTDFYSDQVSLLKTCDSFQICTSVLPEHTADNGPEYYKTSRHTTAPLWDINTQTDTQTTQPPVEIVIHIQQNPHRLPPTFPTGAKQTRHTAGTAHQGGFQGDMIIHQILYQPLLAEGSAHYIVSSARYIAQYKPKRINKHSGFLRWLQDNTPED